jgi:di/tricarboxylate transporter
MTTDQIAIFCIVILTFILFVWGKWRYDIVSLISLCTLFIADMLLGGESSNLIIDTSNIFSGFGHPAVITVVAVLIISRALYNSGVVDLISRKIAPFSNKQITHITSLSGVAALCSAIMNNVGALALMLPVALKTAAKQKRSPSIILMPLAFASILGGMITMIGTPPNIIIANFRESYLMNLKIEALENKISPAANYFMHRNIDIEKFNPAPFGMFDFSSVGIVIAILGIFFIALIGWRLIPKDSYKSPGEGSLFSIDEYITEIRIPEECKFIGLKIKDIERFTEDRLSIFGYIDEKGKVQSVQNNKIIQEEDRFLVKSDPVDLKVMMDEYTIRFTKKMRQRIDKLKDDNTTFKEVLITPESKLENRDRTYLRRRTSNSLVLMAIARQGQPIRKRLGKVKFRVGDVLLIQGNADNLENNINFLRLLPLEEREMQIGIFSKVGPSLLIFLGAILLSIFGILPTTLAFVMAVLLYIFTGILPIRQLYQEIDWPIIILLGAMIPVSNALETTGSSQLLATFLINITEGFPVWLILSIIMIITMCLSDIVNNAATALIMAPISAGIAISLNVNIEPFLMAVAVGASCAFLTPIGHQCNAIILGPGGYKFSDYWRMGLPLEILIVILGTPLIVYFWPL